MPTVKNNVSPNKLSFFAILSPMITHFYASACRWLLRFITLQLFVSLMSLPLLVAWGLPLSLLSPFGNSLFNPLLTVFLILATLIFATELMYLPNQWLCWLLEKTNSLFVATSSYADSSWLVGIRQLPLPILFTIPIIGLWIIITPRLRTQGARALALAGTLIVIFAGAYFTNSSYLGACASQCKNKPVALAYADHTLAVFDYGSFNATSRCRAWWNYTVMSQIAKKTGKTTIDYLVVLSPSEKTLEAVAMITSLTPIRHVVIVISPEKLRALQEQLDALMNSLKTEGVSCILNTCMQEQTHSRTELKDQNGSDSTNKPNLPRQSRTDSSSFQPHKLTDKIQYTPHTNTGSHTLRIVGATIICDKQTLTIGRLTDKK
jgi:hypothetical protein